MVPSQKSFLGAPAYHQVAPTARVSAACVAPDDKTLADQNKTGKRARNNVPAVYPQSVIARDGGLLSYGVDYVDIFRRAASYVDRILRGAKPGDLPVQFPTKFEMVLNLKTGQGARPCHTPIDSAARRRGDRVSRRAPSHGQNAGVADSLGEAKAAFRAAGDGVEMKKPSQKRATASRIAPVNTAVWTSNVNWNL
jgi:hypothetical protein